MTQQIDHSNGRPSVPAPWQIGVVVPAYMVRRQILDVISRIGPEVECIYVVDDACPEKSGDYVMRNCADPRVIVIHNSTNEGVGGAMIRGYKRAVEDGCHLVVKLDGDGQMEPGLIPQLVAPIINGRADYTKGNRFFKLSSLRSMPPVRIFGTVVLSCMAKLSTGYWHVFDCVNGYTAIRSHILTKLPLEQISKGYFFETDMLFRLKSLDCTVVDVPMLARYGNEVSNLRLNQIVLEFLVKHFINFCKRIFRLVEA